uniref:Uncharacterized protein n=1 Tax=Panagrolaimus superbus TaxID=310955 RepID=A0A914YRP2_9BILA
MSTTSASEDTISSSSASSTGPTQVEKKEPLAVEAEDYVFDQYDKFYMAPPTAGLLHYRTAAIICGIAEVAVLIGATLTLVLEEHAFDILLPAGFKY